MGLRKASSYSKRHSRPYTRKSKNKSKSYIKVIPANKIVKYHLGNVSLFNDEKLKFKTILISIEKVQVRDNALESCRLLINKGLETRLPGRYYVTVNAYPHHVLRNNKTAAGAGADRLSSGMKHSFGITEGRAARVNAGKIMFTIYSETQNDARVAREILTGVKSKLPGSTKILIQAA